MSIFGRMKTVVSVDENCSPYDNIPRKEHTVHGRSWAAPGVCFPDTDSIPGISRSVIKDIESMTTTGITASPNPFTARTLLRIQNSKAQNFNVEISIYDIKGKLVHKLASGRTWNASGMSYGMYIVKALVGERILTKALLLMK